MSSPIEQGKIYRYLGQGKKGLRSACERPPYIYGSDSSKYSAKYSRFKSLGDFGAQNPEERGPDSLYFEEVEAPGQWQWTRMDGSTIPGGGGEILYRRESGTITRDPLGAKHWMQLPPDPKPALPESIWINSVRKAHVDAEGNVNVGCETFPYERMVELVELAKKTREENA
jgi:hypothetical protein